MKRMFKVVGMLLVSLLVLIVLLFVGVYVNNKIQLKKESQKIIPYGQEVIVDGKSMRVQVTGEGEETMVLLPGYLTASPVLDFQPLVTELAKNYKVVVVEPFGYGLSEDTKKERSIENLTSELHQAFEQLGINSYHIVGHSIAGVYSLSYINQYPEEVKSFIGIDSSLPAQGGADDNQGGAIKLLSQSGIYRLFANVEPTFLNGPDLSKEDNEQFNYISFKNIGNKATINEGELMQQTFDKVKTLSYPTDLPVLYFLASESIEPDDKWLPVHEKMIENSAKSDIKILDGSHYLHHTQSVEIGETIQTFLD
ncbi:alpha/beta hydrolase [Vagococcus coleopterorum]|uniref:Alpha/beta hydrolase n=1 Tax=Vagococcus coleopterorum TaxID=2714946 RepID=A0A6G8AP65_9ENTE|nr:alpha/beta hydrolase [Vagococcus coleopterorum]QIL46770.1 alpha/beta hydrolase [Vagococcus coleopterorum]